MKFVKLVKLVKIGERNELDLKDALIATLPIGA